MRLRGEGRNAHRVGTAALLLGRCIWKKTASRVINAQLAEVKTFAWPFLAACFQVLLKGFIGDCMRPSPAWFGGDHWI